MRCNGCEYYYSDVYEEPCCHAPRGAYSELPLCSPDRYSVDFETFGDFLDEVGIDYEVDEDGNYIF